MQKLLLVASALSFLPMEAALAQSASGQIAEIVVTARKREERLQDVPVAVSAMDQNAIRRNAVNSIENLASMVPALTAGQSQLGAGGSLYLRGVGSGTGNALIDQSVSINIDGVAMAQALGWPHKGQRQGSSVVKGWVMGSGTQSLP